MSQVGVAGDPVLSIRGVRKTFEAEQAPVRALRGLDFAMARAEFVAVMGPSGCGKSTMLNLVAGLDAVDEGASTSTASRYTPWTRTSWPGCGGGTSASCSSSSTCSRA